MQNSKHLSKSHYKFRDMLETFSDRESLAILEYLIDYGDGHVPVMYKVLNISKTSLRRKLGSLKDSNLVNVKKNSRKDAHYNITRFGRSAYGRFLSDYNSMRSNFY